MKMQQQELEQKLKELESSAQASRRSMKSACRLKVLYFPRGRNLLNLMKKYRGWL